MQGITTAMPFKTRGPITVEDNTPYIERDSDRQLTEIIQRMDYVTLVGPKHSGKSSTLMRLWSNLFRKSRFVVCYTNLSLFKTFDEPRWYNQLFNELRHSVGSQANITLPNYSIDDAIDLREILLSILEDDIPNKVLVLLLDDVETVPMQYRTSFFATLREMFVSRGVHPTLRRITFALAGSYIPDDLIPDPTISPFRVAEKVYIPDGGIEQVTPLFDLLKDKPNRYVATDVKQRVFEWTEGDLYLTQRVFEHLDKRYPTGKITPIHVDQIVEQHLFEDDIFQNLEAKLRANPRVLEIVYKVVGQETSIRFTRTNKDIVHAWLMGVIKPNPYNNCIARNAIYQHVMREIISRVPVKLQMPRQAPSLNRQPTPLHGRYELEGVLKRGMISHLYRARDIQTQQLVAVKQLVTSNSGDIIAWRRFQQEAEALLHLNHPYIVTMVDRFHEDDYNYIVMEYINGGSMDSFLSREGRQPIDKVVQIMLHVADALRYTHTHQIVHRDIKPGNILLTQDFSPRLADFGVAYFHNQMERLTAPDTVVGTPAYLAPEGYRAQHFQPTGDVWAMGVTLYEMLTGAIPFTGRTQEHIRYAVLNADIPDVRSIRPDVPDALAKLITKMLERDYTKRLPDGTAIWEALTTIQNQIRA